MTVHTGTRPPRYSTARSTQHGLMQMDAVLFSNASSQIRRMSSQPASAFSSVWSTFANISLFCQYSSSFPGARPVCVYLFRPHRALFFIVPVFPAARKKTKGGTAAAAPPFCA